MKLNKELYRKIDKMVWDIHGEYYDENTYDDILTVIKFGLGMTKPYPYADDISDYLYDIICELGIIYGRLYNKELVDVIKQAEYDVKDHVYWLQSCKILDDVIKLLEIKDRGEQVCNK